MKQQLESLTTEGQVALTQEWDGNAFVIRMEFANPSSTIGSPTEDFKKLHMTKAHITFEDGTVFNVVLPGATNAD